MSSVCILFWRNNNHLTMAFLHTIDKWFYHKQCPEKKSVFPPPPFRIPPRLSLARNTKRNTMTIYTYTYIRNNEPHHPSNFQRNWDWNDFIFYGYFVYLLNVITWICWSVNLECARINKFAIYMPVICVCACACRRTQSSMLYTFK